MRINNIKLILAGLAVGAFAAGFFAFAGPSQKAAASEALCHVSGGVSVSGTTATANFTVPQNCQSVTLSLVSYQAPSATFSAATADQQVLFAQKTYSFGPGPHVWSISIPSCYYQVDLVYGNPIVHLSATNLYGALRITGETGGTQTCGGQGGGEGPQVTLCHATDSMTNPYVRITVDEHAAYHGHYVEHKGPVFTSGASKWGDIIPPFTFDDQTYSLNWTEAGQAIFNNNCQVGGQGGGQVDCDGDFDSSPASECQTPQKDCDGDFDSSPASECTGGQGGGTVTPPVTPPTGGQGGGTVAPAVSTTTTTGGQGGGVVTTPTGGVNAGGNMKTLSGGSVAGLLISLASLGLGVRRLNNKFGL